MEKWIKDLYIRVYSSIWKQHISDLRFHVGAFTGEWRVGTKSIEDGPNIHKVQEFIDGKMD